MLEQLKTSNRILMHVALQPVQGDRFQPTGFPDIGGASYLLHDGTRMLLVESSQSIANRLEATIIDQNNELISDFEGLSYIRAKLTNESKVTTNSLIEAHRINSPFIISDKQFQETFKKEAAYSEHNPIDWQKVAKALFKYDVNSLLHGAFLANLGDGRIKMPRAVSGFIEAKNVQEVVSGGVKNNPIDPTGQLRAKNYGKDVYGNVPYQRIEYTAETITGYFNIDIALLKSYGLGDKAYELLVALALYKIRAFLDGGIRLRTACDLKTISDLYTEEPLRFSAPALNDLSKKVKSRIRDCKDMFAEPSLTEIVTEAVVTKKKAPETPEATGEE